MRYRTGIYIAVICMCVLLTGCGSGKQESTEQGMAAIEALDYQGALTCFEKALANGEDPELVYRGQGIAYIGLTQYEDAAASLEKALSYCRGIPGSLEYDTNYYLAMAYYKSGEIDKALAVYDAILDLKKDKTAYCLRGILELEKDNYDRASADFDKAISMDPTDYDCLIDIYTGLERFGYKEAGKEYLEQAMAAGGETINSYDKGRLYYYLEDYEEARNSLEQARDLGGEDAVLYLGRTYEALGDYNYAASVYVTYLEKHDDSPEVLNQLGLCRMQKGEYQEALEAFQRGIELENNSCLQALKFNEITAYEHLTQYKKAAVLMEAYLQSYPDDSEALREYEFLKTR